MAAGTGSLTFRLITVLLLFVPGILSLYLLLRLTERKDSLSNIQRYVYGSLLSIASMAILYIGSPFYFDTLGGWIPNVASSFGVVSEEDLSTTPLSFLIALYLIHVSLTVLIAFAVAKIDLRYIDTIRDRRDPWHYAFAVSPEEGETVEVVTNDGRVIHGDFNPQAWDEDARELYLDEPESVEYDSSGESIEEKTAIGRSMFIHTDNISRVIFLRTDPQSGYTFELDEDKAENIEVAIKNISNVSLVDFNEEENQNEGD